MKRFGDYVKYYNDLDVSGMVEGIEKMIAVKISEGMDMFKDSVSLSGLTQHYVF